MTTKDSAILIVLMSIATAQINASEDFSVLGGDEKTTPKKEAAVDNDFSVFGGETPTEEETIESKAPEPKPVTIKTYKSDEYELTKEAIIVEFYEESKGPLKETESILQKFANDGFTIIRVGSKNGKSKLGAYFRVTKVPTFLSLYKQVEIARLEGIPTDEQITKLRDLTNDRKELSESVVDGQVVYFTDEGLYISEEARQTVNYLIKNGYDVRKAVFSNEDHKKWFSHYKIEKYPTFLVIDKDQKEVMRRIGNDGANMLKLVKGIWDRHKGKVTVATAGGDKMLYFTADWCTPCHAMKPIINALIGEGYNIQKVDVDRYPSTAAKYRVTIIPAYVFLGTDGKEYSRMTGQTSKSALKAKLAGQ